MVQWIACVSLSAVLCTCLLRLCKLIGPGSETRLMVSGRCDQSQCRRRVSDTEVQLVFVSETPVAERAR